MFWVFMMKSDCSSVIRELITFLEMANKRDKGRVSGSSVQPSREGNFIPQIRDNNTKESIATSDRPDKGVVHQPLRQRKC